MAKQMKPDAPAPKVEPPAEVRDVPKHRQCPTCFGGMGGIGVTYCTHGRTRYYKCSTCGHTWTATILPAEVVKIENRPVELTERAARV